MHSKQWRCFSSLLQFFLKGATSESTWLLRPPALERWCCLSAHGPGVRNQCGDRRVSGTHAGTSLSENTNDAGT